MGSIGCAGVLESMMPCSPAVQFYFQHSPGSERRAPRALIVRRDGRFLSGSKRRALAQGLPPNVLLGELYRGSMLQLSSEESWSQ